jgi:glycosyltransferase involved in cell wall biosynthesis
MRVLHLIDHLGPGGAQTLLIDLLEAEPGGCEHQVISLTDRALPTMVERLQRAGVPWESLNANRSPLRALMRLRSLVREWRPDVLHTQLDGSNTFGAIGTVGLKAARPGLVLAIENDPAVHYGRLLRSTLRFAAARADVATVLTESLRCAAAPALARARRVELLAPGIDLEYFRRDAMDARTVQSLRKGAPIVIGSVGRLSRQKGYDLLLDALPTIRAAHPAVRLVLAGDGGERSALERQAERLGLTGGVDFLGHLDDPRPVFAALDVFVLPSRHEGFGIVFLEAMAMGAPIVGTRVVGSSDAVQDGKTGLLVDPESPRALADGVLALLADAPRRRALVQQASRWVAQHGCRKEMARRMHELYELGRAPREAARVGATRENARGG